MELPIVTTKLEIGTQEKSEKTLVPVANDQSVLEFMANLMKAITGSICLVYPFMMKQVRRSIQHLL